MGRREKAGLFAEREKEELALKRGPLFSVWQSEGCIYFGNSAGKARLCVETGSLRADFVCLAKQCEWNG